MEAEGGYSLGAFISTEDSSFLFRKSSLLLALRRRVEGLDFFLTTCTGTAIPLDSMEKMKLEPAVREMAEPHGEVLDHLVHPTLH